MHQKKNPPDGNLTFYLKLKGWQLLNILDFITPMIQYHMNLYRPLCYRLKSNLNQLDTVVAGYSS
jgi:hypothetical protein